VLEAIRSQVVRVRLSVSLSVIGYSKVAWRHCRDRRHTGDVDVVVGRHEGDAWLDAIVSRNVRLDLEAHSSVARVTQSQYSRCYVCVRPCIAHASNCVSK